MIAFAAIALSFFLGVFEPAMAKSLPATGLATAADDQKSLELLMASQRMDKRAMLKSALELTPPQSDRFWPIYYEYQAQLIPLYDKKFALIEQYAAAYPLLTERQADHLVRESLAAKKAQIELLEKYYRRVAAVLSKNIAARFVQMESAWNGAFDVKLLSKLPLMPETATRQPR
jgi:hypothetical protein